MSVIKKASGPLLDFAKGYTLGGLKLIGPKGGLAVAAAFIGAGILSGGTSVLPMLGAMSLVAAPAIVAAAVGGILAAADKAVDGVMALGSGLASLAKKVSNAVSSKKNEVEPEEPEAKATDKAKPDAEAEAKAKAEAEAKAKAEAEAKARAAAATKTEPEVGVKATAASKEAKTIDSVKESYKNLGDKDDFYKGKEPTTKDGAVNMTFKSQEDMQSFFKKLAADGHKFTVADDKGKELFSSDKLNADAKREASAAATKSSEPPLATPNAASSTTPPNATTASSVSLSTPPNTETTQTQTQENTSTTSASPT